MSERGSFCTSFVYCDKCFEVLKKYLLNNEKQHMATVLVLPLGDGTIERPIIAGKLGGSYPGSELDIIWPLLDEVADEICHEVTITIIPDSTSARAYVVGPESVITSELTEVNE